MLIALLATAAAQDTRIEVSLDDGGVGGPITFAADALRVGDQRGVNLSGTGGAGGGGGKRILSGIVVSAPLTDTFPLALTTYNGMSLPGMTVQVFEPGPTGSEQVLYEYQGTPVALLAHSVSVTESAARVELNFRVECMVVTAYAYDELGNQTRSTTDGWSYSFNEPCTIP